VARSLPTRSEVSRRFTWNAESVFPEDSDWEKAVDTILASLPDLEEFKGHLGDSPETLADWFDANERAHRLFARVVVYTTMSFSVDVGDQKGAARSDRMRSVGAQLAAASSFAVPEMLAIGVARLREWVASSPRLAHLGHYFDRLEKLQKRIRSAEVEELLSQVSDPLATALTAHSVLANTDLRFAPAVGRDGELHEVAQGTIAALLTNPDREVRRTAFESYADQHLEMKHAMAATLGGGVKRDVFFARARG
jgi:oligoendopeptidase F